MPTPFIELKNVGKIYVSEGNVAVGIRGVNLAFSRGEFVAVTGASGSGKSTLLNVISGMDTYEEGELYIEGQPTAHYMQKDWEEYRKKYISFIFQEYNIIESFTVLQNVELALMNISNPKERRERALALLRRVGLEKFIHHKGSKLSGGQKQRTVIARALAKDSPVILADEPTGNLDSQTSAEIIQLLREVSRDKLVIVVTHNFEQVEACATRHIRVFDGAVESDHVITPPAPVPPSDGEPTHTQGQARRGETIRNAMMLGRVRFAATPRLSVFLCVLMTVVALLMTAVTSASADAQGIFDKNYLFTHVPGRVVIIRKDGAVITDEELNKTAEQVGAVDAVHYDYMMDREHACYPYNQETGASDYLTFTFSYPADGVQLDAGRLPEAANEMILRVPLGFQMIFGDEASFRPFTMEGLFLNADYVVTGVAYYVDNTVTAEAYFTADGYRTATALAFFERCKYDFSAEASFDIKTDFGSVNQVWDIDGSYVVVDFDMVPGTYALTAMIEKNPQELFGIESSEWPDCKVTLSGTFTDNRYQGYWYGSAKAETVTRPGVSDGGQDQVSVALAADQLVYQVPDTVERRLMHNGMMDAKALVMAPDVFSNFMMQHYFEKSYTQASLLFGSDAEAHEKVSVLQEMGYTAVSSDETVDMKLFERIMQMVSLYFEAIGWVISIAFITLFLGLCSSRAMEATKGDIAIMRSMGIPTKVVKASIYFQTLLALIPAVLITAAACIAVFRIPATNAIFQFLHARDYLVLLVVLIVVDVLLSRKYVKRMFGESVKKTLKGGNKS